MFLFLWFAVLGHEILWLGSGQKIICDHYRLHGDKLILQVRGQRYSIGLDTVDWDRTRGSVEHEEPTSEGDTLPGGRWATRIERLPAVEEPEPESISDLVIDKLTVKDVDLVDLLRFMADMAEINMVIDGSVPNDKATYQFRNIAWDDAFHIILQNANLACDNLYGAVRVKPY